MADPTKVEVAGNFYFTTAQDSSRWKDSIMIASWDTVYQAGNPVYTQYGPILPLENRESEYCYHAVLAVQLVYTASFRLFLEYATPLVVFEPSGSVLELHGTATNTAVDSESGKYLYIVNPRRGHNINTIRVAITDRN